MTTPETGCEGTPVGGEGLKRYELVYATGEIVPLVEDMSKERADELARYFGRLCRTTCRARAREVLDGLA